MAGVCLVAIRAFCQVQLGSQAIVDVAWVSGDAPRVIGHAYRVIDVAASVTSYACSQMGHASVVICEARGVDDHAFSVTDDTLAVGDYAISVVGDAYCVGAHTFSVTADSFVVANRAYSVASDPCAVSAWSLLDRTAVCSAATPWGLGAAPGMCDVAHLPVAGRRSSRDRQ